MNNPIQLDAYYFVLPQLLKEDLEALKSQGFERIINNRPERESDDQPDGESLRIEADRLGLEYVSNPIDLSALSQINVESQASALKESKKTLAFCRTGTRSSVLWVLLEHAKGKNFNDLDVYVTGKGYDLSRCLPAMTPLLAS